MQKDGLKARRCTAQESATRSERKRYLYYVDVPLRNINGLTCQESKMSPHDLSRLAPLRAGAGGASRVTIDSVPLMTCSDEREPAAMREVK